MSIATEIVLKRRIEAQEARYQKLVRRLIELQQNAEDSADEALMAEKHELYVAYKFYAYELHEIIDDTI